MKEDLLAAIADCSVDLQATRFQAPIVYNGRVVEVPASLTIGFRGSVQPLSAEDLQLLPEGMRVSGRMKLYTTEELRTVETSNCDLPDQVAYRGVTYQVEGIHDWEGLGGFYRIDLERVTR